MASDFKRKMWAMGEICQHDSLGRKCDICALSEDLADADATITQLRADLALLGAECREARLAINASKRVFGPMYANDFPEGPRRDDFCNAAVLSIMSARTQAATDSSPTAAAAVKGST